MRNRSSVEARASYVEHALFCMIGSNWALFFECSSVADKYCSCSFDVMQCFGAQES